MPSYKVAVLVLGLVLALVAVPLFDLHQYLLPILQWIEGFGPWGPPLYVVIYCMACVLFFPSMVLSLSAGILFGAVTGVAVASLGLTLGATAAFLLSRYVAGDLMGRLFQGNPRFNQISDAVAREGWKIVGLTRLPPLFPFIPMNYAYGLTRVPLRHYVVATWLGMLPKTVMYVYFGSLISELAVINAGFRAVTPFDGIVSGLAVLFLFAVMIYMSRIVSAALKKSTPSLVEKNPLIRL